jgi:hypothetical protein
MKRHTLILTALVLVLASLLAGPAAAQSPRAQNEYRNSGWYTGLEHRDLPPAQSSSSDDYLPWLDPTVLGIAVAAAAALLATTVVASRVRHRRVAA